MKKNIVRFLIIIAGMLIATAASAGGSGTCGDNLTWTIDDNGVLTISGTGDMDNFEEYYGPWFEHEVRNVIIEQGVTGIGDHAFEFCSNLLELTIPDHVKRIGMYAIPSACRLIVNRNSFAHQYAEQNGYNYIIQGEEKQKQTGAKTVNEIVREVIANEITPDMSEYRKALLLHNWLCRHCEYDFDQTFSKRFSAEGALVHGLAVCAGYSKAYSLLLSAAGIENRTIIGSDEISSHEWNLAKLDGHWCHIDVTFDDLPFDEGFILDFFALTDDAWRNVPYHKYFTRSVQCNSYRTSHAYRSGLLQRLTDYWMEEISAHITGGEIAFETIPLQNFTFSPRSMTDDYGMNPIMAAQMLQDTGVTVNGRYYPVSRADCKDGQTQSGFCNCFIISIVLDTENPNYGKNNITIGEHVLSLTEGTKAGCLTEGIEDLWICSHCGERFRGNGCLTPVTKAAIIPAKGHALKHNEAVPANCTTPGSEEYWQCADCGQMFSDKNGRNRIDQPKEVPANGHTFFHMEPVSSEQINWITVEKYTGYCAECLQSAEVTRRTSTAELPGDVNNDGIVNGQDVIRLMNYFADEEDIVINEPNADVNMNGIVDEPDLLRLMEYLAGKIDTLEE